MTKYKNDEERKAARREQQRLWAKEHRKPTTYKERVDKMTLEQYQQHLENNRTRMRRYYQGTKLRKTS